MTSTRTADSAEDASMPSQKHIALAHVILDIEKTVSTAGWGRQTPTLYALVHTADLISDHAMPSEVAEQIRADWDSTPEHLSAIVQEDLANDDLENILAHLSWPPSVAGAALSVERFIVPPEVEAQAPQDPKEALSFIAAHPSRIKVRLVVGALRSGETWCALRAHNYDSDDKVGSGSRLVPALADAILASLQE